MGYTHYYPRVEEFDADSFRDFVDDFRKVTANLPQWSENAGGFHNDEPIVLCGPMGEGEPIITDDMVSFNGDRENDLDHETFYFPRVLTEEAKYSGPDNGKYFQFCKTARKPYDLVVCCALMLAKHYFGDNIEVRSDGTAEEWSHAVLYMRYLGFDFECPIEKEADVEE